MAWSNLTKEQGIAVWTSSMKWMDGERIRIYAEPLPKGGWKFTDRGEILRRCDEQAHRVYAFARPFLERLGIEPEADTFAIELFLGEREGASVASRNAAAENLAAACRLLDAMGQHIPVES